jgi:Na+/melibiose symporter-like transporter
VPHTMYGDVVDAGQLKFRERLDGQMSGFTNFINKIAQAVGLAFVMFLLGLAGFQERAPGAAPILSQPDTATTMIRVIMAITPLVFMGIGILISRKYKLDKKAQAALQQSIHNDYTGAEELLGSL